MGRKIWQSDYPVAMIKAVKSIVHENYNFAEAYDLFLKESKAKIHNAFMKTKSTTLE